ncbi:hypothetical protein GTH29_05000 [Lactobacillus iners]|nr:hypothetical protein [Lactobacillus iners]
MILLLSHLQLSNGSSSKVFKNGLIISYKENEKRLLVLEVKKNTLNNSYKWFTFGQKIRP